MKDDNTRALVSLHDGHHNKTPKDAFPKVEAGHPWRSAELLIAELIAHIQAGRAWCACLLDGPKRNEQAAGAWNLIALDIDGDLTLEAFWALPFAQRHCLFSYTTPSHRAPQDDGTPGPDRFRAVFHTGNQRLDGVHLHRQLYRLVTERLGLKLNDDCGEKPERLWFGNDQAEFNHGHGEPLSWDLIDEAQSAVLAAAQQREQRQQAAQPLDDDGKDEARAIAVLDLGLIRPSTEGEYDYWQRVLNAAAAFGTDAMHQAFMAWHYKGFHSTGRRGKPAQRMTAKRWEDAGKTSARATLLAMAKEQQGKDWWKLLPEDLQPARSAPPAPRVLFSRPSPTTGVEIGGGVAEPDRSSKPDLASEFNNQVGQHLYSRQSDTPDGPHQSLGPGDDKPEKTTGDLIHQLYLLRAFGTQIVNGDEQQVPGQHLVELDRHLLGQILECKGYANSPSEVERDLIGHFRWHQGLTRNTRAPVLTQTLTGDPDQTAQWLVPNWILAKREHVLYSKAGVGKTMLAIQLSRAITGDPSLNEFLDSGPISGYDRWGKSRVLFIGTDMYDSATEMTNTYLHGLGLTRADFLRYVDWWFEDSDAGTPGWELSLPHLTQLFHHLKDNQEAGTPVAAVIIDSMKAVCPDHLLVGQQAFKDYLRLVYDICTRFDAALIWIHHAAGNNQGAQGIQRITEGAAAVFKMERDDNRQVTIDIEKIRGGKGRKLVINPFSKGTPMLIGDVRDIAEQVDDRPVATNAELRRQKILDVLRSDFDNYRAEHPDITGDKLFSSYKGLSCKDLLDDIHNASDRTIRADLQQLVQKGVIEQRGHAQDRKYRLRLDENGEPAEPYDLFTAGF